MLWLRIISALIGIPLWVFIISIGESWLALAVLFLIIIGTFEFKAMLKIRGNKILLVPIILGELVLIWGAWSQSANWFNYGLGLSFFIILFYSVFKYPKINLEDISANIFILIYVGWSLTHIVLLRNTFNGALVLVYLFLVIWSTDTGAYFAGRFFGKTKLAPLVSPKKTIEGAIGGLLLGLLAAFIFNLFFQIFTAPILFVSAFLISILGQVGDLVESCFKRLVGIKDSGKIIPGHGGILDRFDSTILTAPALFYLLAFLDK
ncbi:MAG: hypothetical protein JM58_03865 [Peptococcaceae bacterium BICA1-8]|nr:MAG: hypothetical protein JM58_03865 [Peptococcaceae bacterium BICA1-8]